MEKPKRAGIDLLTERGDVYDRYSVTTTGRFVLEQDPCRQRCQDLAACTGPFLD